jgi:Fic family protein
MFFQTKYIMVDFLPPKGDIETKAVLRKAAVAHRWLAELKGLAVSIPNESILINTLTLQEARESSAIENIITTYDQIYRADLFSEHLSAETKEVYRYAEALRIGFQSLQLRQMLSTQDIIKIQETIVLNNAGYRRQPGTKLLNDRTGKVVYTPPQEHAQIVALMENLLRFINEDDLMDADPLVKMAIMHHQFETIHPFYDGNGRAGRILNILYLNQKDLLDLPILYLSRYITQHKGDYYRLLQEVRDTGEWEAWILYILDAVEKTAIDTIGMIGGIKSLMQRYKQEIRSKLPKIYSQDLLNNLFRHPYTKIDFIMKELQVTRITATRYLDSITDLSLLDKQKIGRDSYYINTPLFTLLSHQQENQ